MEKNRTTFFALPANVSLFDSGQERSPENGDESRFSTENTMLVMVVGVGGYMFLVVTLMVWCSYCRSKRKAAIAALGPAASDTRPPSAMTGLEMTARRQLTFAEQRRLLVARDLKTQAPHLRRDNDIHSQTSSNQGSKSSKSPYERLQYPRTDLQLMMVLGHGEFGEVSLSKAQGLSRETIVMVKSLQSKDEALHIEFKREMDMFDKLNHSGVCKLLAICRDADPLLMVLEYTDWGDLKQFLLASRPENERPGPRPVPLDIAQVMSVVHQIANGCEYITNNRFILKDLATRNCLVNSALEIKLTSSSLSKDTYASDYISYRGRDVPCRWAPFEAVIEDEWSAKSDVFSFAVTVWEIFHQAELPHSDKSNEQVLQLLKSHRLHLDPPNDAPLNVQELLTLCWDLNPRVRPNFSEITSSLGQVPLNGHL